jgi:hypothetical protein
MKKIIFFSLFLLSASSFAQQFHYQCEGRDLKIMLSPNAAFLDGKSFEYKNGETNGETTKMTFFGPSGEVLKFLVNPVTNLYRMGLTSGATFEEINCTEIQDHFV